MKAYLARRLLLLLPVLIGVSMVVFLIAHLTPGDPVNLIVGPNASEETRDRYRALYGLDKPLYTQYFVYLGHVARGDLGRSIISGQPVIEMVAQRAPLTLQLSATSLILAVLLAIPLGVIAAVRRNTIVDHLLTTVSVFGVTMPPFWLGILLLLVFAVKLRWFPVSGYGSFSHLVLPAIALSTGYLATLTRLTRSSMLEVLRQDYIRTARSNGLAERIVLYSHALKNAFIPIISVIGLELGWLIGGAVIIETVFARPGMGLMMVNALNSRDFPVIQGVMLILSLCVILGNLLADVLYALVDPRISLR